MSTWYLQIQPQQEPFDVGPDAAGRAQCAFNMLATKRPSGTYVQELLGILERAGLGVTKVDLFGTSQSAIPDGPGPYVLVRPTAGTAPLGTHNDGAGAYRRPGLQVLVTARSWDAAEATARKAYDALIAARNLQVEVPA
jgi:hypothetical protein